MTSKILVVDDSPETLCLFKTFFKMQGYQVNVASNGHIGYKMAFRWVPDLILSDLEMPVWDGLELFVNLKFNKSTSEIPFILTSGKQLDNYILFEFGITHFVPKPTKLFELGDLVDSLLKKKTVVSSTLSQ